MYCKSVFLGLSLLSCFIALGQDVDRLKECCEDVIAGSINDSKPAKHQLVLWAKQIDNRAELKIPGLIDEKGRLKTKKPNRLTPFTTRIALQVNSCRRFMLDFASC